MRIGLDQIVIQLFVASSEGQYLSKSLHHNDNNKTYCQWGGFLCQSLIFLLLPNSESYAGVNFHSIYYNS